jgi:hypothetical protein
MKSAYVIFALMLTAVECFADFDCWFQKESERYKFSEWHGYTEFKYGKIVDKWIFPELNLTTNGLDLSTRFIDRTDAKILLMYSLKRDIALKIFVYPQESVCSAHEKIIYLFSSMTSGCIFDAYGGVGDKCFIFVQKPCSSVIFSRNNVTVDICTYREQIDALDVAKQIDKEILTQSNVDVNQPTTVKHCNVKDD